MPSATHGITPGTALGMAIDASGKRIRISSTHFTDIDGGEQKSKRSSATQVFIPQARAKRSTADFFEFVAYCIREYIHTQGLVESKGNVALIPLGVSIGLPVSRQNGQPLGQDMCSPLSCTVAEVSKEDSLDLGDRDVARHLYDAILRNHLPVRIASVTNNVVSSLVAAQFNNKTTRVAASFNHGINAAYIKRHPDNQNSDDRLVAVNTEIGRFGSAPESLAVLPMTL
ncbi:Hexokinase isoenzyme 2, partial [Coemansia erecta]